MGATLPHRLWEPHVIARLRGGHELLHVDRHLVHDLSGPGALGTLRRRGLPVRNPALTFATPDHCVSTEPGRSDASSRQGGRNIPALRERCAEQGIRLFDIDDRRQGIVHVVGPELGLTLPGALIVCGDSHTCTHGGLGALAWGIGSSELVHVLATQTVLERRPRAMRVRFEGAPPAGVTAKDLALALIARVGADGGAGHAVEYAGSAVRALSVEERMTLCNLSIELGAKMGFVAPDDTTFEYLAERPLAPRGADWERALEHWRTLRSDADAAFDRDIVIEVGGLAPQVTWGTSPAHATRVDGAVPDPETAPDAATRDAWRAALDYIGLEPDRPIAGTPIDRVFIGSCTNARLSDLEAAAAVVRGGRVADGVVAWVVPGSTSVQRAAEARGLDRVFRAAGFEWRAPGCSMCVATNGEIVEPGQRCLSTSNRNFVGRQGPGARTHLASPATAAASALAGRIADPRVVPTPETC